MTFAPDHEHKHEHKQKHRSKYYDKPFEKGSVVMSLGGPTRILGIYDDGDYQCEDYGLSEPGEVYSLRQDDVWLEDDYPDWVYDHNGINVSKTRGTTTTGRHTKAVDLDTNMAREDEDTSQPLPVRNSEYNL
jgi:hypothetical protein